MGVSEVPLAYAQIPVHSCISAARWGALGSSRGNRGASNGIADNSGGRRESACSFSVSGKGFMEHIIYGYVYVKNV